MPIRHTEPAPSVLARPALRRGKVTRRFRLELDQVRPVIHIAHRLRSSVLILSRQIIDHELVLFLAGSGEVTIANRRYTVGPHTAFLIPPFTPHAFNCPQTSEHIAVHFDWSPTIPSSSEPPATPGSHATLQQREPYRVDLPRRLRMPCTFALTPGHRVESLLIDLLRVRAQNREWSNLEASNRLTDALIELLRHSRDGDTWSPRLGRAMTKSAPQPALTRKRMLRALSLMQQSLDQPPRMNQFAQAAGLSPAHFRRLFHQTTGYAPLQYFRRLRMEMARTLLCEAELSIKQVASRVGFDDPYHFSRSFRQLDGRSPSAFREAALRESQP